VAALFPPLALGGSSELEDRGRQARREPEPFVRLVRRRTLGQMDSIGLVVYRCSQCSAGKSQKASSWSRSLAWHSVAFGGLAPRVSRNGSKALPALSRVSAL
jgi:hypothetical protein